MGNVVPIFVKRTVGVRRRTRHREHLLFGEIKALMKGARAGRWGHRDATMVLVGFSHGLRAQELLLLQWSQIDLDAGIFHVKREKGSLSGDHHLRGVEIRALRRIRRESKSAGEFVFVSERGAPISLRGFQKIVERAAVRADLARLNIHPHMLRHSCGYHLGERGADLRLIQSYLGHKNIQHSVRYVQLSPRRFRGLFDD